MFSRHSFLGQVPLGQTDIKAGTGFQMGPVYWPGSYGPVPSAPPGAPMTREITAQGGWTETKHCYQMPDGSHRTLSMRQADALIAAGVAIKVTDARKCPGGAAVLGQSEAPSNGSPASPGAPDASVTPIVVNGQNPQNLQFTFWRSGWPIYPNYAPPLQQKLVCKKLEERSEEEGRDVLECEYEPVVPAYPPQFAAPLVTYPTIRFFTPLF